MNNAFSYKVEFECDPVAAQKMGDMAIAEFEKLKTNGLDSAEFDLVRNQMLALSAGNITSSYTWSRYLTYQYSQQF